VVLRPSVVHGHPAKYAAVVVLAVPGFALERYYRTRRLREREELLPPRVGGDGGG
jgi:hypothetical protein